MIIIEELAGGLKKRYSDKKVYIMQPNGDMYAEAIDILDIEYTETDIPIDPPEEEATEEDYKNELERLGVNLHEED